MMDNSVSSNGFPGSVAGSVPVVTNSTPPLATETVPRPSPRRRLLAALAGLLPRNLPASKPPIRPRPRLSLHCSWSWPSGCCSCCPAGLPGRRTPPSCTMLRMGLIPVAIFTGSDPEGRPVYWSLLATDAGSALPAVHRRSNRLR